MADEEPNPGRLMRVTWPGSFGATRSNTVISVSSEWIRRRGAPAPRRSYSTCAAPSLRNAMAAARLARGRARAARAAGGKSGELVGALPALLRGDREEARGARVVMLRERPHPERIRLLRVARAVAREDALLGVVAAEQPQHRYAEVGLAQQRVEELQALRRLGGRLAVEHR